MILFNISTFDPYVWAIPAPLEIRIIFCVGNILITSTVSSSDVFPEPILMIPPTETSLGILLTKISSIATLPDVTVFIGAIKDTREVLIPISNEFVNQMYEGTQFIGSQFFPHPEYEDLSTASFYTVNVTGTSRAIIKDGSVRKFGTKGRRNKK